MNTEDRVITRKNIRHLSIKILNQGKIINIVRKGKGFKSNYIGLMIAFKHQEELEEVLSKLLFQNLTDINRM